MLRKILLLITASLLFPKGYSQLIQDPDDFHGPRTKWVIYPDISVVASRHSIIPQLSDLSVSEFMYFLETTGANSATLNLENRRSISDSEKHDMFELTPVQINKAEYTAGQRSILLSNFLIDVQKAIDKGEIEGNIRFHVHQRLYLRKDATRENEFIEDFSNFINLCKARGVDHLIAGIRLGEHGTDGSKYLLQSALRVAKAINENTNGWLKNNGGLEWSGDGYGRDFANINSHGTLSTTFIQEISQYTGYFAFCYKAFGVGGELQNAGFNKNSATDWETFLRNNLGFNELIAMIQNAREAYPNHANVIFIGDSGDAMKLIGEPEYTVTTNIISEAGDGFKGIIGINGYRRPDKGTADDYLYFWDAIDKNPPAKKVQTIRRWEAWPYADSKFTSAWLTVYAMAGQGGQIIPSGPVQYFYESEPEFKIEPAPGYEISEILINGEPSSISDTIKLNPLTQDASIQVRFKTTEGKAFKKPVDKEIMGSWIKSDKSTVWHFNDKYCIYKSNTVNDAGSFYALYWYDTPDSADGNDTPGTGEAILLNNDAVNKIWSLNFTDTSMNQIEVGYSDGSTGIFNRYIDTTPINKKTLQKNAFTFNPVQAELNILNVNNLQSVKIFNLSGKLMSSSSNAETLSLNNLQKGIYIVQLHYKAGIQSGKILIR